ncbi:MAG: GyrI-like domain-containing protein [Planctomycetota bacterium]
MKSVDIKKDFRDLYRAGSRVEEVNVEPGTYLSVDGQGAPGAEAFSTAIQAVYSVAYTIKFGLKRAGVLDFKVPPLEVQWLVEDPKNTPMSEWRWRALLRVPDGVTAVHVSDAHKSLQTRKGVDASRVRRTSWRGGRELQTLHVGPYDLVAEAYKKLFAHARGMNAKPRGNCTEVYLNDPRRTAPAKLKTIVRMPIVVARASEGGGKTRKRR